MSRIIRATLRIALTLPSALCATFACAQTYPTQAIRFIVPYPPGSPVDNLMRQIGQEMTKQFGQPAIVDNRPSANQVVAMNACARSEPNGHNFCVIGRAATITMPSLYKGLPFTLDRDFEAVTQLINATSAVVVHPSIEARTLADFISVARAKRGALNYGSLGSATMPSLFMEWVKKQYGLEVTHIPYNGPPPLIQALLSGEIHVAFLSLLNFVPQHQAGKLRIVAVSGERRSPLTPEIPTLAEQGLTELDVRVWFGLLAPAGTPRNSIAALQREVARIFAVSDFRERHLIRNALEPVASSPDDFLRLLAADMKLGAELVRISGARAD